MDTENKCVATPLRPTTQSLHTDTSYFNAAVQNAATLVLTPANRARVLHLDVEDGSPTMFVGDTPDLVPGNGRIVNPITGLEYKLGPDRALYAVTLGAFGSVIYGTIEDSVEQGHFTDSGSGIADDVCGGGSAPQERDSTADDDAA